MPKNKRNNNSLNKTLNNTLNNPAILTASDVSRLERLQDEFCADCGKDMILVAYKG